MKPYLFFLIVMPFFFSSAGVWTFGRNTIWLVRKSGKNFHGSIFSVFCYVGARPWQSRVSSFYLTILQLGKYYKGELSYQHPELVLYNGYWLITPCKYFVVHYHGKKCLIDCWGKCRVKTHGAFKSFCLNNSFLGDDVSPSPYVMRRTAGSVPNSVALDRPINRTEWAAKNTKETPEKLERPDTKYKQKRQIMYLMNTMGLCGRSV